MPPKRKSSDTAIGYSLYQLPSLSASKRRLVAEDSPEYALMTKTSTNMSNRSTNNLTSPSLENITTRFDSLNAPFPNSTLTTPITPEPSHIIVPPPPQPPVERPKTYLILGASRGIGLEFARQLLEQHNQVIAVVRDPNTASQLWQVTGNLMSRPGSCIIEQCDIGDRSQIELFMSRMQIFVERGGHIDTVIVNAGILQYDQGLGALQVEFDVLEQHLRVNCIGNIVLARRLLLLNELPSIRQRRERSIIDDDTANSADEVVGTQVIFISSDSASMADFREYEDGFATYGASKVALNMMTRHMAAELRKRASRKEEAARKDWQSQDAISPWEKEVCVLAMHPGEVSTDMANIQVDWDVEGVISPEESVRAMLKVIDHKGSDQSGTFWRWDGTQHPW